LGRIASPAGALAPVMSSWPPGNCLDRIVFPLSRERAGPTSRRSASQSRIIGATRSFENDSPISTVGWTTRIGDGSWWMKYRIGLRTHASDFPDCDGATTVISCVVRSLIASMIGTRYGAVSFDQRRSASTR
jgi:hypothetical protein